ncbi:MAG: hypothetical protein M1282_06805 [Chloroflexi bacterium]|nr:hypothetical protein [Chloroflexota bacterium]
MNIAKTLISLTMLILLAACSTGTTAHVGYQPPLIPITVSIDSNGNLQVEWEGSIQTPLGTFSAGVSISPSQMFPNSNGTLTVRVNGEDTVYDLGGNQNININLDSGYYEKVNLQNNGRDWLFEVVRISDNGSSSPTSSYQTSNSCSGAPAPHLTIGSYAYVSDNPPIDNLVRSGPGLGTTELGSILNGHSMKILDGPQCGDGYYWWRVQALRNASVIGWTAEGDSSGYWLIPCDSPSSCP